MKITYHQHVIMGQINRTNQINDKILNYIEKKKDKDPPSP